MKKQGYIAKQCILEGRNPAFAAQSSSSQWASTKVRRKGAGKDVNEPCDNVYVSGLPLDTDENVIMELFSPFGTVTQCKLLPDSGKPDRAALVRLESVEAAMTAVEELNQK